MAAVTAAPALRLDPVEREVLAEEVERFVASLSTPEARRRYRRLGEAVAAGEVQGELTASLEELLEIALASGEVRRVHGPDGERTLAAVFRRTPRGEALGRAVAAANRALSALRGQRIEGITLGLGLPGSHTLVVETDRCRLRFEIGRDGVAARDLAVAL